MLERFLWATLAQFVVSESVKVVRVAPYALFAVEDAVGDREDGPYRQRGAVWEGDWMDYLLQESDCDDDTRASVMAQRCGMREMK